MNIEIITLAELRVATVPHRGPYDQISTAFTTLGQIAGRAGLLGPRAAMLGIYYDNPQSTPPTDLRSAAGITVTPDAKIPAGLTEVRVAPGRYARAIHKGGYEELPRAWPELIAALLEGGHQIRNAPSLEIYRNTPGEVPKAELVTELYEPVR